MSLARTLVSGVALPLLLVACEDPVEPGNQLTREESVALLKGAAVTLGQVLEDSTLIVSVLPDTIVARCPLGGLAKLHGVVIEEQGDTAKKVLDLRLLPDQCAIAADGIQLTIDAAPALAYQLRIEIIPATSEFTERAGTEVREEMAQAGLRAMPVEDQMRFQWAFIRAGLGAVGARRD